MMYLHEPLVQVTALARVVTYRGTTLLSAKNWNKVFSIVNTLFKNPDIMSGTVRIGINSQVGHQSLSTVLMLPYTGRY
jgi:hypothetical protein